MKFRTEIELAPLNEQISYQSPTLALGSCFAAEVGARMAQCKLPITVNPTGVLFNPISIATAVDLFSGARQISPEEIFERGGIYSHHLLHSSLSATSREECFIRASEAIEVGAAALKEAKWVILTLGTAWIYEKVESGEVVTNCHKMPAAMFNRRALSLEEITTTLAKLINGALAGKNVILTLSPIRHLADGMEENSLSKALLRVAIANIVGQHPKAYYFPSYEIVMDDLRDYRFFREDMVHPTSVAVDYIWDKFAAIALNSQSLATMERVKRVVKATDHRPFNSTSEAHRNFCRAQIREIDALTEIDFGKERAYFASHLD